MSQASEGAAVLSGINSLHYKRHVDVKGIQLELVLLVHPEGWRPLQAAWWTGKETSVIGADQAGNFFLRLTGGAVGYWSHVEEQLTTISPSVRAFIASIH